MFHSPQGVVTVCSAFVFFSKLFDSDVQRTLFRLKGCLFMPGNPKNEEPIRSAFSFRFFTWDCIWFLWKIEKKFTTSSVFLFVNSCCEF